MKKLIFPILASLFLFTFLNSCKKSDNPVNLAGKIRAVTFAGSYGTNVTEPYTQQVFYNANGTIDKYTYTYSNLQDRSTTTYHYSPGKILKNTEIISSGSAATSNYEEDYLDANGKVDSMVQGSSDFDNISVTTLKYDSQNQLIEMRNYKLAPGNTLPGVLLVTDSYTYSNGNLVKFVSSAQPQIITFEYSSHVNNINGSAGSNLFINTANLVTKSYRQTPSNPTPELGNVITYTFDSNDRVAVETTHNYSNGVETGQISTRTFTYY